MKYICQSCGIPLSRDDQEGGTEADGSKSTEYCSYCYEQGVFTHAEMTSPAQMQALVMQKLQSKGFPKPVAWLFTLRIPKLARWKSVVLKK
jgi:Putative zinc ribbon domain